MTAFPASFEENARILDLATVAPVDNIDAEQLSYRDLHPVDKFYFDPSSEVSIKAAQLHARVYLSEENGYVSEESVNELGILAEEVDPYAYGSEYFYYEADSEHDNVAVVSRQIPADKKSGIISLPTLREFECDPGILAETAGVGKISEIRPSEVVEISALASEGEGAHWSVVRLYSEMMRNSLEKGHKLWVMSTDSRLTPMLDYMLLDNLRTIGESKEYLGSVSDPRCLSPEKVLEAYLDLDDSEVSDEFLLKTKEIFLNSLEGINVDNLPTSLVEKLEISGINVEQGGTIRKALKKNKAAAIAGAALTGYAALRAVPLAAVDEFEGSPVVFGALDVGTVPSYVVGLNLLYGKTRSVAQKAIGGVVASASFAAPYAYIYAEGQEYPMYVNGVIGAFVLGGVAKEVVSRRRAKKAEDRLIKGLQASPEQSE